MSVVPIHTNVSTFVAGGMRSRLVIPLTSWLLQVDGRVYGKVPPASASSLQPRPFPRVSTQLAAYERADGRLLA